MDCYPEREIAIWECMAYAYAAFVAGRVLPMEVKREALIVTLDCCLGRTAAEIVEKPRRILTKAEVLELLDHYAAVWDSRHAGQNLDEPPGD